MSTLNDVDVDGKIEVLKAKIVQALRSDGVTDAVASIDIRMPEELKGEHFATETVYAKINFQDTTLPPKNLFVKKFSNNPVHTEMVKKMKIMEKETAFFTKTLPDLRQFTKNFPGCENVLDFFPKCLFGDETCVIFENLVLDKGYIMLNKDDEQDFETAKIVIRNLAKYHACTYAFIETMGREKFREQYALSITEAFDFSPDNPMAPMFDNGISTCLMILNDNPLKGSIETIENLKGLLGQVLPQVHELLTRDETEPMLVLNHGDCWNNNMLFKKDTETGKIIDHIFVDLQITRYGSPCLDLGYYFFTSVKPEVRKGHLEDIIKIYIDQFDTTAKLMGRKCPIGYEGMMTEYKRYSKLGYYFALSMKSAIGAFKELDMEDLGTDPETMIAKCNEVIHGWIERNPDKANEISKMLVDVVEEFKELQKT